MAGHVSVEAVVTTSLQEVAHFFNLREGTDGLPLKLLLSSSLVPVVKVLLIGVVGLVCALPGANILSSSARKHLSKLIYCVFLPSFIFVRLGEAINLEKLIMWWFIPVNVILASAIGCGVGALAARLTRCPPEFTRIAAVMAGIGNQGNMPIVLISAICSDARNPFGEGSMCDAQGVAYIAVGMWMAALIMWGGVYNFLAPPEEWLPRKLPGYFPPPHLRSSGSLPQLIRAASFHSKLLEEGEAGEKLSANGGLPDGLQPLLGRPLREMTGGKRFFPVVEPWLTWLDLSMFLRPPLLAACLAMVFGIIPAMDSVFFNTTGQLRFASDSIGTLGHALVPCILLVLGGNMAGGPTSSDLPRSTTVAIVITRMVLMPIVGLCIVAAADKLGLIPSSDPMFKFALLLQHTMPASVEIGTCCSLHGFGEKEVSAVLFFQHVTAVFTMTFFMVLYLYMLFG